MGDLDPMNVDALLDDALAGKSIDEKLTRSLQGKENTEETKSNRSRSRDRSRKRSSSRDRRRSSSRDRHRRRRSRSRDRRRSRSRDRDYRRGGRRSRSRDRRRSRSRDDRRPRVIDHRRSPRRSPPPRGGRLPGPERRDVMPFTARQSPPKDARMDLSPEERDFRTLFVLQLARQTRPRDLEEFFSSVGHVRDVRIITDSRTGRSKGIGYVEFWEEESVALGLALNGQKLLGAPLVIQRTCAERNRAAQATSTVGTALGFGPTNNKGPVKLNLANLHPNIDESMLRSIFEPFGRVDACKLNKDNKGQSLGVGYVTFAKSEDGHKAAEQLNGFDLAGMQMQLRIVDEDDSKRNLHDEERTGMISGQVGRAQMMQKLSSGSNMAVPEPEPRDPSIPAIATQCFVLSNMFDPKKESQAGWEQEIKDDVMEECSHHGGALHIYVDKSSEQGNVYVKCPNVSIAHKSVTALHGRWFSGKVITANYVPVDSYHELFPESKHVRQTLQPRGNTNPPPAYGAGYR